MPDLLNYVLFTALGAAMTLLVRLLIDWRREVREFAEEQRRDAEWDRAHGIGEAPDLGLYRTGRKVGRTIYRQAGPEPSDGDVLIGMMDTPELAAAVVAAMNAAEGRSPSG